MLKNFVFFIKVLKLAAFHDAVSDIVAVQIASPNHLSTLNFVKVDTTDNSTINHLLWLALEKFPLMAYAYVLDKWRWDVFSNSSMENLNQHWWDLRYMTKKVKQLRYHNLTIRFYDY